MMYANHICSEIIKTIISYFFHIFYTCRSFQPVVLSYLIARFSDADSSNKTVEMYASGSVLVGLSIIIIFTTHHATFGLSIMGMRLRIATSSLIYRKVSLPLNFFKIWTHHYNQSVSYRLYLPTC